MSISVPVIPLPSAESEAPAPGLHILVVDDSRAQRAIIVASLRRSGFRVSEAGTGEEAMQVCLDEPVEMIISDWMMPGMSGLEFCRAFREMSHESYGYFILMTSKTERAEIAHGLEVGADDFITKPVNAVELRARITAGQRILDMHRELTHKNRLISNALEEIRGLYDTIDHDLHEAKKLQQSLVRERFRDFGAARLSLLLRSSGHVGGDLVGFFPAGGTEIGLFALDVSGHGITSALLTARLAGYISGHSAERNICLQEDARGDTVMLPPELVVARLNEMMFTELQTEHYFTIALARIDMTTGTGRICQAGHPNPAIQRAGGTVEYVGDGGLPVGLIEDATFESFDIRLAPGDRLLLCSDGITECENARGEMLDQSGLAGLLARNSDIEGPALLEALIWNLIDYRGEEEFGDDISAVLLEYPGDPDAPA